MRLAVKRHVSLFACVFLFAGCGCDKTGPNTRGGPASSDQPDDLKPMVAASVTRLLEPRGVPGTPPPARPISLAEYTAIKLEYARAHGDRDAKYALVYEVGEGGSKRGYWLTLAAFDDERVWVAELTQHKSKAWNWIALYVLARNVEVDKEFQIAEILHERTKVLGGVQCGMTVDEVLARKGNHFKVHHHQVAGSASLVYDDITVSVRDWHGTNGTVTRVEPTTDDMRDFIRHIPYEDEPGKVVQPGQDRLPSDLEK